MQTARAHVQQADPLTTGCTTYEQWRLDSLGFRPHAGQMLAAGLAPLWAEGDIAADEAVWLAELVHVSPSRDGAILLPANDVHIKTEESAALFQSAQDLFPDSGFELMTPGRTRWRVQPPSSFQSRCASPSQVALTSVNAWWPQEDSARPWRRLVNELQMLWFDHEVNLTRQEVGLPPINSLWLFGGASLDQFETLETGDAQAHDDLLKPFLAQDWSSWSDALAHLERTVFASLDGQGARPDLILTGTDRIVKLTPATWQRWTRWMPGRQNTWRNWWSPQD